MSSSEQVAAAALAQLGEPDRRLVGCWRSIGYDVADALLCSGVLGGQRRHPSSRTRSELLEHADRLIADRARRASPMTGDRLRRQVAEHEAAHVVVARALRCHVRSVQVGDDGAGHCEFAAGNDPDRACIAMAPVAWSLLRRDEYPADRGCANDHLFAVRAVGEWGAADARDRAMGILAARRPEVLTLADDLMRGEQA